VGANGVGKSTLLRLVAGLEGVQRGRIQVDGRTALMPQFVGTVGGDITLEDFLLSLSDPHVRKARRDLIRAERAAAHSASTEDHIAYAAALGVWGEVGGYEAEVLWDTCCTIALGRPFSAVAGRELTSLSGGEQKRLALEVLFRSEAQVLLLDEPDNFLDIPGKRWLERTIQDSVKSILFVSHDRALLANTATRIVTLEAKGAWTHGGSFVTYDEARRRRLERIDEERRRYREEHDRLVASMKELKRRASISDALASRAKASVTKLERFEETQAPPERAAEQNIRMQIRGGRTGKIAFRARRLSLTGLVAPFDIEIHFGERIGVVGSNGTGKSHFLALLAGAPVEHAGEWMLGARVEPSLFSQLHDRPDLGDVSVLEIMIERGLETNAAMAGLRRYELRDMASQPFSLLSGGQQARFQLLLMELASPTMLLLDEPTDNLDVASAEALEEALAAYQGTVIAVTHDRWFMRLLHRFLIFEDDGSVRESAEHPYA
jgi:ATPase subunit of ABC transporter with duplicated ATPase domains